MRFLICSPLLLIILTLTACSVFKTPAKTKLSKIPPKQFSSSFITTPNTVLHPKLAYITPELPPLLSANQILGRKSLATSYYSIDPSVVNDGIMNHYQIYSIYGDEFVAGRELLHLTLNEIRAFKQIDDLSTSKLLYDTVTDQTLGILTAPIRALMYTGKVIANPSKLYSTASEVPGGVGRLATTAADKIGDGSKTVSSAVKEAEEDVGGESVLDTSLRMVTKTGQRFLGYRRRYRDWMNRLKVDPSTTNQKLTDQISNLAWLETSIDFGFNFLPGLPGVAAVSTFNRYHRRAEQIANFRDDGILESETWKRLNKLKVKGKAKKRFFKHPSYSATNRFRILDGLIELSNLEDRNHFIAIANQASSLSQAFFYAQAVDELISENKRQNISGKFLTETLIPIVKDHNNKCLVILPADYFVLTDDNQLLLSDILNQCVSPDLITIKLMGTASNSAKKNLESLGIKLIFKNLSLNGLPIPEIVDFDYCQGLCEDEDPLHPRFRELIG